MIHSLVLLVAAGPTPQSELVDLGERRTAIVENTVSSRPARTIRLLDVADLTGADRLAALRDAIENDLLDEEVRYAALERYLAIVENGEIEARANGLVHAIETFCDPAPSAGDLRIAVPTPGELIVAAPADAQAWIDDFLASMRTFGGLIDVDLVVFNAPSGTAEDVWDGRTAVVLDEGPTRALLQRLNKSWPMRVQGYDMSLGDMLTSRFEILTPSKDLIAGVGAAAWFL